MIILLGKTNSGKTTVQKKLCEQYGYKRIITCTTRPMREGEIDGETYHFLTDDEFFAKIADKKFAEYRSYNSVHGVWFYGSLKSSYRTKNGIIILNPYGFKEVQKKLTNYKEKPFSVFLDVNDENIRARAEIRGDDTNEIERRILTDTTDFSEIKKIVDFCIDVNSDTPEVIAQKINDAYLYRKYNEE